MIEAYLFIGFLYTAYVYVTSPKENRPIGTLPDFGNTLVTAMGCASVWPLVVYINHFWKPKS